MSLKFFFNLEGHVSVLGSLSKLRMMVYVLMICPGDYHKAVPRIKDNAMDFDAAHGHKLRMPIDSKQGSGFDLDWQYDSKKRNRVIKQRSLNPDHPLYHRLTPKIVEEGANTASSSTRGRVQSQPWPETIHPYCRIFLAFRAAHFLLFWLHFFFLLFLSVVGVSFFIADTLVRLFPP